MTVESVAGRRENELGIAHVLQVRFEAYPFLVDLHVGEFRCLCQRFFSLVPIGSDGEIHVE